MKQVMVNKQLTELPDSVECVVPQSGIRVDAAPGYFQIDGVTTLACCDELPEDKAQHILPSPLFAHFFRIMFPEPFPIPLGKRALEDAADDVRHITGMIILLFEAMYERKERVFIKNPETHLHPAQTRCIMSLIEAMKRLGTVTTTEPPQ